MPNNPLASLDDGALLSLLEILESTFQHHNTFDDPSSGIPPDILMGFFLFDFTICVLKERNKDNAKR